MRGLLACVLSLACIACGQVKEFNDGGGGDDSQHDGGGTIDAKPGSPDATPFDCDQQSCGTSDSCCPSACNANNDPDCQAVCDNGVLEQGEHCDPLSTCVQSCQQVGCQLSVLTGAGTCNAQCVDGGQQSQCVSGDGCCPSGCNANDDLDCGATCGNGVIESGEVCDGNCPTSCPQQGCDVYALVGGGTCQAQCVYQGAQSICQSGDACCAGGCNANNDAECAPVCGNGIREPGETCDGADCGCPYSAPAATCYTPQTGSAATCDVVCSQPVQSCGPADTCCPYIQGGGNAECNRGDDGECAGPGWRAIPFYVATWAAVTPAPAQGMNVRINVYGIQPGDSVLFTTCTPDGSNNTTDTYIASVLDVSGNVLAQSSDDTNPVFNMLPTMAGWNCTIPGGSPYLSTAPMNDGGFIVPGTPGQSTRLTVNFGGFNPAVAGGATLYIWWNGNSNPNRG